MAYFVTILFQSKTQNVSKLNQSEYSAQKLPKHLSRCWAALSLSAVSPLPVMMAVLFLGNFYLLFDEFRILVWTNLLINIWLSLKACTCGNCVILFWENRPLCLAWPSSLHTGLSAPRPLWLAWPSSLHTGLMQDTHLCTWASWHVLLQNCFMFTTPLYHNHDSQH